MDELAPDSQLPCKQVLGNLNKHTKHSRQTALLSGGGEIALLTGDQERLDACFLTQVCYLPTTICFLSYCEILDSRV